MAIEWASQALTFLREGSAPIAFSLSAVTGAFTFVPAAAARAPTEWKPYFLGVFLLSAVASLAHLLRWIGDLVSRMRRRRRVLATVRSLSPEAKALLRAFLSEDVIRLDAREVSVDVLTNAGFIYRGDVSQFLFVFDFTLVPAMRPFLTSNPKVFQGAAAGTALRRYGRDDRP